MFFNVSSFPLLILEYGFLFFSFFIFFIGLLFSPVTNSSRFAWFLTFIVSFFFILNYFIVFFADYNLPIFYDAGLISINYIQLIKIASLICLFLISCIGIFITKNTFTLEFVSLLTFSQCATLFLLSTDHLLIILLFVETQALIGYILTVYKRSSVFATEAGIKYFLLGGVSSSILLLGSTLLYSAAGSFYLTDLYSSEVNIISFSLLIFGFLFKLSAAPFHFWTPDVYEDIEYLTIGYFSTIPKFSVIGLLSGVFYFLVLNLSYLFLITGLLSLVIGTLNGVYQTNLKRLLAYSTISNTSYILLIFSVSAIENQSLQSLALFSVYFQFIFYAFSVLVFVSLIQSLPSNSIDVLNFFYFSPFVLKLLIVLTVFSLAGVPPLLGFFSKAVILYSVSASNSLFFLCVLIPLFSLLSQFYYTRVVANVFFVNSFNFITNFTYSKTFLVFMFIFGIILNLFFSFLIYVL